MDWDLTVQAHKTSLEMLHDVVTRTNQEWAKYGSLLEGRISSEVRAHLGNLDCLIQEHGSLRDALSEAIAY